MCGIVGYLGHREASPVILDGLKRLEYRGYDSAGIAVLGDSHCALYRVEGKLAGLVSKLSSEKVTGQLGIGHTRWATHGKPSVPNAHPHQMGRVILVHNGIIENYLALKELLPLKGRELKSETDTEIICHLINQELKRGARYLDAVKKTLKRLEGTYALAMLDTEDLNRFYVARKGSPLVVGIGEGEVIIASDIPPILPYTRQVVFMEDGELAECAAGEVKFYDKAGKPVQKEPKEITWSVEMAEKGGYKHFMLKEILEQPRAVEDTLLGRIAKGKEELTLEGFAKLFENKKFPNFNRFYMVACGTSWHSAMAGKYFMEAIAKVPVSVDTASEFRYREPFVDRKTLLLVISQSGETADTLACVQAAKAKGAKIISICNVVDSSIARLCHANLYTQAGPEIGVASTKAFTTQLTLLLILSLYFGGLNRAIDRTYLRKAIRQLTKLPGTLLSILKYKDQLIQMAQKYGSARDVYYIARGVHYPIALEGALKLKEISYIHAEGYSAGEMKHGPIALIEPGTPVVALAPKDRVCEKMISNIQEMKARGAVMLIIATEGDKRFEKLGDSIFYLPPTEWYITPILASIPLQLFAYHVADLKGTDVDQPRNLAKSVTVE